MSVTSLLQYAFERFDANEYDDAVKAFMAAHTASDDSEEKSDIFGVLRENFIEPNRQEFRKAYRDNIEALKARKCFNGFNSPEYGELSLDMIPVSDEKYYIWDKIGGSFWGSEPITVDFENKARKKLFDSIIIDGFSDMRSVIAESREYEYAHIYFVIEDEDTLNRFFSFLAIPNMSAFFKDNVHVFREREELFGYLYRTGNYIPKTIKINSDFDYAKRMEEIHRKRLQEPKKNKPFLSIGIPTLNRGKKMLENVKHLQEMVLDEEIEFVISNNSSVKETEFYDEIETLAKNDSRIKYRVMPSDSYAESVTNVLKLISSDHGLFSSDEDYLIPDRIMDVLQEVFEHQEYGIVCFGTDAGNLDYYRFNSGFGVEPGTPGFQGGLGCNYITGLCFDMKCIRAENLIEKFASDLKDKNEYYMYYTHSVYAAYLGYHKGIYATDITLFSDSNDGKNGNVYVDGEFTYKHIFVEARIKQADDQINTIVYFQFPHDIVVNGIFYVFSRIFNLTRVAYGHYYDEMVKEHSWEENCKLISDFFNETMNRLCKENIFNAKTVDVLRENFIVMYSKELSEYPERF